MSETLFYYRFIYQRQNLNMLAKKKLTSIGQKLSLKWQEFWHQGVADTLTLRRRADIINIFSCGQPLAMLVYLVPISHVFNTDQSPQCVDLVHTTSLAPKVAGKWGISTSGKEKEQVTTQFWGGRNIPKKQVGKTEYGEKGQQNFHAVCWQLISC